jgi:hypothetical protein
MRRLWLYFTPSVLESRPQLVKMIQEVAYMAFSQWTVLNNEADWLRWHAQKPKQCFRVYLDQNLAKLAKHPPGAIGWIAFVKAIQRPLRLKCSDGIQRTPTAEELAAREPASAQTS